MSTHIIHRVEGDLAPPVNFDLVGQDITGWTIQLQGTYRGTFQAIDIAHTADVAADGKGHFDWGATDLIKGVADWEIFFTPAGGSPKPFTIPAENSLLLQVRGKKEPGPGVLSGGGDQITIDQDGRILKIFGAATAGGIASHTYIAFSIAHVQGPGTTRYNPIGGALDNSTFSGTEANTQIRMNRAGSLKNARVWVLSNLIPMVSTITLRINGADTAMVMTIPAMTAGEFVSLPAVAYAAGDLLSWEITVGSGGGLLNLTLIQVEDA